MASKRRTLIQRSNVLEHPLAGGQAGLSRELGLPDERSGMLHAWGRGTEGSVYFQGKDARSISYERSITNLVYDQTMQGTIIGVKASNGTRNWSEV